MATLFPYLSVVDYINLRRATVNAIPSSFTSPAELLFQRLVSTMKQFTHLEPALVDELIHFLCTRDDFYLSGGFLVALLRGDPFDPATQDLDFFVTEAGYAGLQIELADTWERHQSPESDDEYAHVMPFIQVLTVSNCPVQFIVHESKEKLHQSIATFDLPICRNYFSRKAGLRIARLEDLTRRRTIVETSQLLSRIYGLEERTHLLAIYEKNANRIEKYRRRGFDVQIRVADSGTLDRLINPKPEMPSYQMIYELMGMHTPPQCHFCPCKESTYNPECYRAFHCKCEHHLAFNAKAAEKKQAWRCNLIIKEHLDFWSNKK